MNTRNLPSGIFVAPTLPHMTYADLLFSSSPLVIRTELAAEIGLNEAIILQQIRYWEGINRDAGRNLKDGYYWTYNSYRE